MEFNIYEPSVWGLKSQSTKTIIRAWIIVQEHTMTKFSIKHYKHKTMTRNLKWNKDHGYVNMMTRLDNWIHEDKELV